MRIFAHMKRLTKEEKAEMIELYTSGQIKIPRLLDEKYGVYNGSCYFILKRRGLIIYSLSDQKTLFNKNYFDLVNTEKKAYFLGLLAADGTISDKKNTVSLSLIAEDGIDLLNELKKEMDSKGKIIIHKDKRHDYLRRPLCTMQFTNAQTKNALNNLGLHPKKTTNLDYPKINKDLNRHFIRGFIDGDGSFYYKRGILVFSLVGTESILSSIQQILKKELGMEPIKLIRHKTGVYYLNLAHKKTMLLREWIYKDSSIHMKRKRNMRYASDPGYVNKLKEMK